MMFHGCPPSPDVWGRLSRDPVSNIYRGTATFTALGAGPITASLGLTGRDRRRLRLRCLVGRPRASLKRGQETAASLIRLLSLGLLSSGLEDEPRDVFGTRDQREMAGLHFDGLGAHPFGHEALKVWIDCAVFG